MPREGYKTITVKEETYELLKGFKPERKSWDLYFDRLVNVCQVTENYTTVVDAPHPQSANWGPYYEGELNRLDWLLARDSNE